MAVPYLTVKAKVTATAPGQTDRGMGSQEEKAQEAESWGRESTMVGA